MKFSIKDFFIKCDQIRRKLRIWSHLLKKSLMERFIFMQSLRPLDLGFYMVINSYLKSKSFHHDHEAVTESFPSSN